MIKGDATLEGANLLKVSMKKKKRNRVKGEGEVAVFITADLLNLISLD